MHKNITKDKISSNLRLGFSQQHEQQQQQQQVITTKTTAIPAIIKPMATLLKVLLVDR